MDGILGHVIYNFIYITLPDIVFLCLFRVYIVQSPRLQNHYCLFIKLDCNARPKHGLKISLSDVIHKYVARCWDASYSSFSCWTDRSIENEYCSE